MTMEPPPDETQNNVKPSDASEGSLKDNEQEEEANASSTSNDTREDKKRKARAVSNDKLEERRQANRRSAMESRERKKRLISDLQDSVTVLSEENKQLKAMNETMRFELQTVMLENQQLRLIAGQAFPQGLPFLPGASACGAGWMQQPNALPGTMNVPMGGGSAPPLDANALTAPVPPPAEYVQAATAVDAGNVPPTKGGESQVLGGAIPFGALNMSFALTNMLPGIGMLPMIPGFVPTQTTTSEPSPAGGETEVPKMTPPEIKERGSEAEGNILG